MDGEEKRKAMVIDIENTFLRIQIDFLSFFKMTEHFLNFFEKQ